MNDVSAPAHADDFSLANTHELEDGLNDDLRARVKNELEPGERLLWAGRSNPALEPRGVGFYVVRMITLLLLGAGLFLIMPPGVIHRSDYGSALVVGLAFLGISGLFLIGVIAGWIGRLTERRRLVNTCYAITDRRVIMWTPEPRGDAVRVQALGRGQIKSLVRIERPDGSGHLEFYGRFKFTYVPEVRRVEQIVRSNLMTSEPSV
jgi:hypothetical protein